MSESNNFVDGAIAVLDVLGIKGIWERESLNEIVRKWKGLVNDFNEIEAAIKNDQNNDIITHIQFFSDTVIVTYEGKDPVDLISYMSLHLTYPFCHSILQKIFLRGSISVGKFLRTESLIVGPALDEAANYYEYHNWMGMTLAPSARTLLDETFKNYRRSGWYEKYNVPTKNGFDENVWSLNWPSNMKGVMSFIPDSREARPALREVLSNPPNGENIKAKYDNTLKFFDEMISKVGEQTLTSSEI